MGIFVECGVGRFVGRLQQAASRQAMDVAVRTLIEWTSDDPGREGCAAPERDVRAYRELFEGYRIDPIRVLQPRCEEPNKYDGLVVLGAISTQSAQSPKL